MHALLHWLFASRTHDLALGRRLAPTPVAIVVIASQVYWWIAAWRWLARRAAWWLRLAATSALALWYAAGFVLTFTLWRHARSPVSLTAPQALLAAPFQLWLFGSVAAFLLLALFWLAAQALRVARRAPRAAAAGVATTAAPAPSAPAAAASVPPPAPSAATRRDFLRRAAAAAPFAVGGYALLRGRVEIETSHPRIALARLPAAFHGFRIAQLSDIHIGPFMTETEVRDVARRVNALRPDLIALTGDFVTWDPATQTAAVAALSGLRAPYGVFGCLGNHEVYTHTERSITRLFHSAGVTILRQSAAMVRVPGVGGAPGAQMQLLGVDFVGRRRMTFDQYVVALVPKVGDLMLPGMVNILLAHHPNCFFRSAELGIDLTLSGHTHGGQICCLTPELSPGRLISPFVAGHFRRAASHLYVNRGLGTIALPMRLFAPPEITLMELQAAPAA
jgi:predicted MPP superfamily phosphohydrolase